MFSSCPTLLLLVTHAALSCMVPSVAHAQEPMTDSAMLVFDASGSMWGQIEADHKIEIARTAVAEMLDTWDAETDLGLIAYGHRNEGDCRDIELLLEPQSVDTGRVAEAVNGLNPLGKTPLSDAVVMAAEVLGYAQQKSTVILLTDGLENCGRDPCEVGRMLEDRGIDFTAHIIAFDVATEDQDSLSCLARNTGGLYLQANDMQDLSAALREVGEVTVAPEIILDMSPATITVPEFVIVGRPFLAEWTGPKNPGDWLHIRDAAEGVSYAGAPVGPVEVGTPVEILAPAEIGTYEIRYEVSNDIAPLGTAILNVVTVLPSVTIPRTVPAGADFNVEWTGPASNGDRLWIVDLETSEQLKAGTANIDDNGITVLTAPETIGTFEVRLVSNGGQTVLANAVFDTTPVAGSITMPDGPYMSGDRALQVAWTGPRNNGDRLATFPRDGDRYIAQRPAFATAQSPTSVRIPREPGAYTLRLVSAQGTIYAEQDFDVLPAE